MRTSVPKIVIKVLQTGLLTLMVSASGYSAPLALEDVPLFLSSSVDPNVLVNMSVETPMGGAAYTDQAGVPTGCAGRRNNVLSDNNADDIGSCYFPAAEYLGYFDPEKCYTYSTSNNRFNPAGATASDHSCSGQWSGNFLNWVSMTAIDMFIWTMTGGNRVQDTTSLTVVRRARKQDNNSWFPRKVLNSSINVAPSTVTPYTDTTLYFHNTTWGFNVGTTFSSATGGSPNIGSFNVDVRVCRESVGLEDNCVSYGSYSKPEGLIQQNALSKRFGVLSYTFDGSNTRHGGVLRSNMKYVGPTLPDGSTNARREYGSDGILISNPDNASGLNSGVINYINQFSTPGYKSLDPIGELFYEGIRYFKNLGPTPEYSAGLTTDQHGGFQVVTDWDDPMQYRCQKNFMVAINDANPWLDKRLPGTFFTSASFTGAAAYGTVNLAGEDYGEPSNADPDINVRELTNRVGQLEGLNGATWTNSGTWTSGSISGTNDSVGGGVGTFDNACTSKAVTNLGEVMGTCPGPGKQNSYYVAGLAYYANTNDLRDDLDNDRGIQNVESFIIDTQEFNSNPLDGPKNMLWLAGKYGGFNDLNGDGIPQATEWDSDGDGIPDNYVLATLPQNLVTGLNEAFEFIDERTTSASAASVNSGSISSETRVYQATFSGDNWTGQLLSYPVTRQANATAQNPEGSLGTVEWDAAEQVPAANARKILTVNSDGTPVPFRWTDLDSVRRAQIDPDYAASAADAARAAARVDYLRGDDSQEGDGTTYQFRERPSKLGDIVSSSPIFVGAPRFSYSDSLESSPYSTFRLANSDTNPDPNIYNGRDQVVYVGANDGMLHGFDAVSGAEVLAFVPSMAYRYLATLSEPTYAHRYFVDGAPNSGDVFINGEWQTVLIGGLGAGGQGIYALNVTNPDTFSEANADDIVMWEFKDTDTDPSTTVANGDPDLGYTFSQPAIVRLRTGQWAAVFGNGYNNTVTDGSASTTGNAALFIVDIETGELIKKLDTGVGSVDDPTSGNRPNGLATPAVVDINGDATVDYAYAGDLFGNMWKFDLRSADADDWRVAFDSSGTPLPLFSARNPENTSIAQPITSRPEVIRGPRGVGMMVLFGTGKYLEAVDEIVNGTSAELQTYYGLFDRNTGTDADRIEALSELVEQEIIVEDTFTIGGRDWNLRFTTQNALGTHNGWYLNLVSPANSYEGERQVSNSTVRAGRVIFTTLIPESDPCDYGGDSWLMELDALSGGRLAETPFDLNNDGVFDEADMQALENLGTLPVSGVQLDVGITPEPGILIGEGGDTEFKYNPGTTGTIGVTVENPGEGASGRQSWRQIR